MRYFPLYEAKMFHQFDHRWATFGGLEVDRLGGLEVEDDPELTNLETYEPTDLEPYGPTDLADDEDDGEPTNLQTSQPINLSTLRQKQDPRYLPTPRYWVSEADVLMRAVPLTREEKKELEAMDPERVVARLRPRAPKWLIAFRDITNTTNERTAIFSALPLAGCGNKAPLFRGLDDPRQSLLLTAITDSVVFDFCARCKLGGTTMNWFYVAQMACLEPSQLDEAHVHRIVPISLELVYTSEHLRPLAEEVCRSLGWEVGKSLGWEVGKSGDPEPANLQTSQPTNLNPFPFDEGRRALLRAELDALVARLYGLNRKQLRYILCPQGLSWAELEDVNDGREDPTCAGPHALPAEPALDFPGETFRVLKEKEERKFGEYRTRRLVLEAWDRLWTELGPVEPLPIKFGGFDVDRFVGSDSPTNLQTHRPTDLEPIATGLFAEPLPSHSPRSTAPTVQPEAPPPFQPVAAEAKIDEDEEAEEEPFALVSPEPELLTPLVDEQGVVIRVRVVSTSGREILPAGTVVGRDEQGKAVLWSVLPDGARSPRKFLSPPATIERLQE